jgi:acetolactate synthase I/II/III large subunit
VTPRRTGAHTLLDIARKHNVSVCFANPGTTELGLVHALNDAGNVRPVLGLFEGVCTGAADGYFRVSGRPAMTLLHLGPGLGNALANLHNARRAQSGIINIVGDHATWHVAADPPLASDIVSLATPMSDTVLSVRSLEDIANQMEAAVAAATGPPGRVVTLIAPSDLMDAEYSEAGSAVQRAGNEAWGAPESEWIKNAERRLLGSRQPVILLGARALTERGQRAAARVADAVGGRLMMESYPSRVELGGNLPRLERLAYFPQDVLAQLRDTVVLLAGARSPVSYFGYPDQPSQLLAHEQSIQLCGPDADAPLALERLADTLGAHARPRIATSEPVAAEPGTFLTPVDVAEVVVALLPEGAIVSAEGATCTLPYLQRAHRARRHSALTNTGGAIGQGLPCGLGAAIARPNARVLCLQSDGSAQYTIQALWTMARERLNITILISANHRYGILEHELRRSGAKIESEPATQRLTRIESPRVDWVALAKGYGVPAVRVDSRQVLNDALVRALDTAGPNLIAMELP